MPKEHPRLVEAYGSCLGCGDSMADVDNISDLTVSSPHGRGFPTLQPYWNNTKYYLYNSFPGFYDQGEQCFCTDTESVKEYNTNLVCLTPSECGICLPKKMCAKCHPQLTICKKPY